MGKNDDKDQADGLEPSETEAQEITGTSATPTETTVAVAGGDDILARVQTALLDMKQQVELSADDIMADIVRKTLEAPTWQDALTPERVIGAQDVLTRPMEIRGVKWNNSRFDDGPAVYAVIDVAFLDDGDVTKVTVGSVRVMAQLLKMAQEKAFPAGPVGIFQSDTPTRDGNFPLRLELMHRADQEAGAEAAAG